MIYVYHGIDYGQVIYAANKEIDKVKNKINIIKYNGYNHYIQDAIYECLSMSLIEENKLIIFENAYFLLSTKTKGSLNEKKQDYKALLDYAKNNNGYDLMLFVPGLIDSKNSLVSSLKESDAIFYEIKPFTLEEYINYAKEYFKNSNAKISDDAIKELFNRTKIKINYKEYGDFFHFNNELNKLLAYSNDININDVNNLVNKPLEEDIFQTVTSLLNKNINLAQDSYFQLRKLGYDPLRLIPIFVSQFNLYALLRFNMDMNYTDNQIMSNINISKGRLFYSKKSCRLSFYNFVKIISDLGEIEKGIKLFSDDGDIALMHFILTFNDRYKL